MVDASGSTVQPPQWCGCVLSLGRGQAFWPLAEGRCPQKTRASLPSPLQARSSQAPLFSGDSDQM